VAQDNIELSKVSEDKRSKSPNNSPENDSEKMLKEVDKEDVQQI
jgi:hypothetical protein